MSSDKQKNSPEVKPADAEIKNVVESTPAVVEAKDTGKIHLDDFLNYRLNKTRHVESLSAFGAESKRMGMTKATLVEWEKTFENFMHRTFK